MDTPTTTTTTTTTTTPVPTCAPLPELDVRYQSSRWANYPDTQLEVAPHLAERDDPDGGPRTYVARLTPSAGLQTLRAKGASIHYCLGSTAVFFGAHANACGSSGCSYCPHHPSRGVPRPLDRADCQYLEAYLTSRGIEP